MLKFHALWRLSPEERSKRTFTCGSVAMKRPEILHRAVYFQPFRYTLNQSSYSLCSFLKQPAIGVACSGRMFTLPCSGRMFTLPYEITDLFICVVHKDGDRLQWQVERCQFKSSPLASVDCTGFKSLHICGLCALYCSSALVWVHINVKLLHPGR